MAVNDKARRVEVDGKTLKEGDWITLNGTKGYVYKGSLALLPADPEKNKDYRELMRWADK